MDAAPILVAGYSGQLACCLREAGERYAVPVVAMGRPKLDIANADAVRRLMRDLRPAAVINAAAYTAVDKAEQEPEQAYAVNRDGAACLARAAHAADVPFIHVSTDYVFNGQKQTAYTEDDATDPLSVYGRSKLLGEHAVLDAHPNAVVLRTSWVYSRYGSNFVRTMLRLAPTQPLVRVVNDQHGSPTSAPDLAVAILSIAGQLEGHKGAGGIYHASSMGATTWHDFAAAIFARVRQQGGAVPVLEPIATSDYPTAARRPANSRLDCAKLADTFGITLPSWPYALEQCLDGLCSTRQEFAA